MSQKLQGRIALIIVDLQNDFLSPQGAYTRGKTVTSEAVLLPERLVPVAQFVKKHHGLVATSPWCFFTNCATGTRRSGNSTASEVTVLPRVYAPWGDKKSFCKSTMINAMRPCNFWLILQSSPPINYPTNPRAQ